MTKEQFYTELDGKFDGRQRPEKILKWLTDLYELTRDAGGSDAEVHIACTSELAAFCRSISDYQNSVNYYEEVLQALQPAFGETSFEYAVTVNNLAGTYRQMGEMQRSEELFLKAKTLFEDCDGEKHFLYASVLNNLGLLCMDTQREEEGLALMEQSMEILEELGGHEEDVATGLLNQAYYYAGKDQDEKAMTLLMKSIRMFTALSYENPHVISAKMLYGQLLSRSGNEKEAKECLLLVLKEIEAVFGKNRDYCTTLQILARICRKYGKAEEAQGYEDEACRLLDQMQESSHGEGERSHG